MVLSPDESLNLRADIKATMQSLEARLRMGTNWRGAATVARNLATKLDALAALENINDGPRHRVQEPHIPDDPVSQRAANRYRHPPSSQGTDPMEPRPRKPRIVITQVEPPALPPGA